jgi:hypothetical protein
VLEGEGGGRGQQKEQVSEQILHEEGGWGMDALWQTIWWIIAEASGILQGGDG